MSYSSVKRGIDVFVAALLLVLLAPVIAAVAVSVALGVGGTVLFRQSRPGLGGRPFKLVKFRSMRDLHGPDGAQVPDSARLTRIGRFLRASSLDELPELMNVLCGEMSLVGPRPLLVEYLPLYTPEQARRHEVRPGITGWAQVNGRNAITWEERFRRDVWYVDNMSFALDARILLLTVAKVFMREGITADGEATMARFTGSKDSA